MNNSAPGAAATQLESALVLLEELDATMDPRNARTKQRQTLTRAIERKVRRGLELLTQWERARELETRADDLTRERFGITALGKIALEVEDCIDDERAAEIIEIESAEDIRVLQESEEFAAELRR